jgi:hypothetical protein
LNFDHPAFAPHRALIDALGLARGLPSLDILNALAAARGTTQARGLPLRFFTPDGPQYARGLQNQIQDPWLINKIRLPPILACM